MPIESCRYHLRVVLIDIDRGHSRLMQIKRAHKLPIFYFIDGDSAILIPHINSLLSGLDYPDINITFVLKEILDRFPGLQTYDRDILVDSSYNYFSWIILKFYFWEEWQNCIVLKWVVRLFGRTRRNNKPSPFCYYKI